MKEITTTILPIFIVLVNIAIAAICLPRKKSFVFTACVSGAFIALNTIADIILVSLGVEDQLRPIRALLYLPLIIGLFKGLYFQRVFGFFMPMTVTAALVSLSEIMALFFIKYDENLYWFAMLFIPIIMLTIYIFAVLRFGHGLIKRLFSYGGEKEWALYSLSAALCYVIVSVIRIIIPEYTWIGLLVLFFVLCSIIILCFAIINVQEKAKQKYEADLSREIISSGRDYYDKLTDMTDRLHVMRHDYKYHLAAMQKMLSSGYNDDMKDYLETLSSDATDNDIGDYCTSRVLNALLDSFAERCKKEGIDFTVKVILPKSGIDDYNLCIIIGNLLENAITACRNTPEGSPRYIDLSMRPREDNYGIKAENSYDGNIKYYGNNLLSTKNSEGLGISSIKSVATRYNGEYVPVWDNEKFSAYVILKLENE